MKRLPGNLRHLARECETAGIGHADRAVAGGAVSDGTRIVEAAACFAVAAALRMLAKREGTSDE